MKDILHRQKSVSFAMFLLLDDWTTLVGRIAREFWWMNQFSLVNIIPMALHTHISPGE
jgi:hypothetical protein